MRRSYLLGHIKSEQTCYTAPYMHAINYRHIVHVTSESFKEIHVLTLVLFSCHSYDCVSDKNKIKIKNKGDKNIEAVKRHIFLI